MALRLPTIEAQPTEGGQPIPYANTDVAGGAGLILAAAGQRFASSMGELGQAIEAQEKEATVTAVVDAENGFNAEATDLLHNADTGYLNTKGEAALDTKYVNDKLQQLRAKWGSKLAGNAKGVQLYGARTAARTAQLHGTIEDHSAKEKYNWAKTTTGVALDQALREAQLNYGSPDAVEQAFYTALLPYASYLQNTEGANKEVIESKAKEFRSTVYSAAIERYIAQGQGGAALQFLEAKSSVTGETVKEMLGSAYDKVIPKIRALAGEEGATKYVNDLLTNKDYWQGNRPNFDKVQRDIRAAWAAESSGGPTTFGSFEAYKFALASAEARQKDEFQSFHTQRGTTLSQAKEFAARGNIRSFAEFQVRASPALRSAVSDYEATADLEAWFEGAQNAPPTQTQLSAMTAFIYEFQTNSDRFTEMKPEVFESTILSKLHKGHQEQARAMWGHALNGKGPVNAMDKVGFSYVTTALRNRGTLPKVGGPDDKNWSEEQREYYIAAQGLWSAAYRDYLKTHNGKAPSPEEAQALAAPIAGQAIVERKGMLGYAFPTRETGLVEAYTAGETILNFVPPEPGTLEYTQLLRQEEAAKARAVADLRKQGRMDDAAKLEAQPVRRDAVERAALRRRAQYRTQLPLPANTEAP